MNKVVITGVSTGIGFDATRHLIDKGMFVYGSVRTKTDADKLENLFPQNFKALIFDVTNHDAVFQAAAEVKEHLNGFPLFGLINNAGIAIPGPLKYLSTEDLARQLDINVLGVHRTTNAFAPLLGAVENFPHKPGRIINISSVSGLFSSPFTGAYCISKYALESMNDVYRREFLLYDVDVIAIQPGPIKTEIWNKVSVERLREKYPDTDYDFMLDKAGKILDGAKKSALPVHTISKLVYKILTVKSPRTKYLVHPKKLQFKFMRQFIPDRMIDKMIKKSFFARQRQS